MTREQAINSLITHGFSVEQVGEIIKAVTPQLSSELEKNSKKLEKGTTKNDLGVDCISRQAALDITWQDPSYSDPLNVLTEVRDKIMALPSVTPQEPQTFKWCTDCKEYDQEKHCCHRWSKVIRNTVEEMKQEQETVSKEVYDHEYFLRKEFEIKIARLEHDKNVVIDKIRAEIETKYGQCDICEYFEDYDYEENDISEYRPIGNIADILQIIDKYKAEREV